MAKIFALDQDQGAIYDGSIRYLMMRPDVLMGAARIAGRAFITALEESAFLNARGSLERYVAEGARPDTLVAVTGQNGAMLGWGSWSVAQTPGGVTTVEVSNSPFAAGFGPSDHPVCGPISGILRAVHVVAYGKEASAEETQCVAQGASCCRFVVHV